MTDTTPSEMTRDHERILLAYDRLAGGTRSPVRRFLLEFVMTLVLTPIGPGLFLLGFVAATAWNELGGGRVEPIGLGIGFAIVVAALWRGYRGRGRPDAGREMRGGIKADRAAGAVQEERHEVLGAKVLREPGQGGRILLLRIADGRVFACYDFDSFLGEGEGGTPLVPKALMRIVRFPQSGIEEVLFDGPEIEAGPDVPLRLLERDWPIDATWWDVAWDDVEDWASGARAAA